MSRRKVGSVRGGSSNTSGSVRGGSSSSRPSTPPPGQSVLPGSIGLPRHTGTIWSAYPENVFNSRMEGANTSEWLYALLKNLNNGGSLTQGYSDILSLIFKALDAKGGDAALNPDMINALFTNLLQYQTTTEGREYDYKMLNESRLYNNPLNELARLMGAGVSRDAAIQILSGAAGGQGVGSASAAPVAGPVAGAGAAALNSSSAHANLVNNVFNGIQLVASLFQQGVDMFNSIQTAQMLSAQNYMSQSQLDAFKGVNDITQAFDAAVKNGILSVEDVQGLRSADDYYKWIVDHSDTNLVKSLIQNGSVGRAFGSTYGRSMLNKHLEETRQGRDSGVLFDNYVRQQIAARELSEIEPKKAYQDLLYAIGELSKQDVEIQNLWNDVWEGNIRIEIAGKDLELKNDEVLKSHTLTQAFDAAFNSSSESPNVSKLGKGAGFLAYNMWSDLYMQFCDAYSKTGQENRDSWDLFFHNKVQAAQLLGGLQLNMAKIQSSAANPELNPFTATLISLWTVAQMTGAYDVLKVGVEKAPSYLDFLTPKQP